MHRTVRFVFIICLSIAVNCNSIFAQYDPAGGVSGSQAVHRDDFSLKQFAQSVDIIRGSQNIADKSLGLATTGKSDEALGKPDGYCISLGDGGQATLFFDPPIMNKPGFDFVIFENGFSWSNGYFLELAFVEVSCDGKHFVRFPSFSDADTSKQIENLAYMEPTWYHHLAGKHQAPYGTPFDLDSLPISDSIDLTAITHVRLIDVVGSLQDSFANRDSRGIKINDPWPTGFASGGFDLDAVGVISGSLGMENTSNNRLILTNPMKVGSHTNHEIEWFSLEGKPVSTRFGNTPSMEGIYVAMVKYEGKILYKKICVIH